MTAPLQLAEQLAPRFADRAGAHDAAASFPAADIDDLRSCGLLGLLVPADQGGLGGGFADYVEVAQALARGSGSTALVFNMHASVTGSLAAIPEKLARSLGASDGFFAHREKVLAAAAEGAMYGVAITEHGAGSRLRAMRTTYERTDGGYRLQGHKSVCSGAGHLDAYLVAARAMTPDGARDDEPRVSHFLVPAGPGIDVADTWDPHGMRATASNSMTLDVEVPEEALLGGVEGLALILAHVMPQWLVASYAAVYVGLAQAALDEAVRHLSGRVVEDVPGALRGLGFVRSRVGRAATQLEAARLAVADAARRIDAAPGDEQTNLAVYRAKLLAGDTAVAIADSLVEACGLGALPRGAPLERILRDVRTGPLMPPSSDVAADVLGTAALGLDPFDGTAIAPW